MNLNATLTKREDQVTGLLIIGRAKKQAACDLKISTDTVVNHTRNIYEKLEINSLGELCTWWFVKKFNIPLAEVHKAVFKSAVGVVMIFLVGVSEFKRPNYRDIRCRTIVRTIKRKSQVA